MAAFLWRAALIVGLGLVLCLTALVSCPGPRNLSPPGDEAAPRAPDIPVKLGTVPGLRLAARPPLAEEQARKIKILIAGLADLDQPDQGLSTPLGGTPFAPLPTNHAPQPAEGLKALVSLGPDALPFLLEALDDPTPTRIIIRHDGIGGAMWHAAELPLNPVNPAEQAVLQAQAERPRNKREQVQSCIIKVGDVCFVAIGQIVGRSYQAVRHQPSRSIVLNCPTQNRQLCAEVRSIWQAKDPRARLFHSLLADYATEGIFNGKSLDGWSNGSQFQCEAALRLMFYFEKEASPLVADRLRKLDVGKEKDYLHRCVANGVRAEDFIKAVAWSRDPHVRAALTELFQRAEDLDALLAALPAVEDRQLIRNRLELLVDALPAEERGTYGQGYRLLVALCERTPETARALVERYLRNASAHRCHVVCLVLREVKVDWDVDLLGPLLADTRTWGWTYAVEADRNEPQRPIRVCDEAAVTLSRNHPELKFTRAGEHADLDRQIAAIRVQLAQRK